MLFSNLLLQLEIINIGQNQCYCDTSCILSYKSIPLFSDHKDMAELYW